VTIDRELLRELCSRTLEHTNFPDLGRRYVGKVRDNYTRDGKRTIIVTDRVSCFDVVVGTIPLKGQVLNQAAAFWFNRVRDLVPHHLLEVPDPAVSVVQECELLPVEFVYRGYLTGSTSTSIWTAYERGDRLYCGHQLPDGLRRHEPLPTPLLTPTTKAAHGAHDQNSSREELIASGAISEELYDEAARMTAELFESGTRFAAKQGLILVDTKYELGLGPDGKLMVIDEIHTPDSSRYWFSDGYEKALSEGRSPKAIDKEYVRLWLGEQGYKGEGPPPPLTDEVRIEAALRYIQAYETISGESFEASTEDPVARIEANLGVASAPE